VTDAPEILLAHHLKTLKLPTFLREYEKLARQCAAEGLDHVRFLARLVELELIDRERRMIERRIGEKLGPHRAPAMSAKDARRRTASMRPAAWRVPGGHDGQQGGAPGMSARSAN
jgi:hypothetical protein